MAQTAKIMLVEDDTNLGEIYQARLGAEGYTIVSAHDGEEALALAAKEKPNLIIADVMMPKISGFEMLDILRNTEGLKDTKVIMLTALGQAEDKQRAESLGADRYLVKSQVTLEDIVRSAQELLGDESTPTETAPQPTAALATVARVTELPVTAAPAQTVAATTPPPSPTQDTIAPTATPAPAATPLASPATAQPQLTPTPAAPAPAQPDSTPVPVIPVPPAAQASVQEATDVQNQIANFEQQPAATPPPAAQPAPTATDNKTANDKLLADAVNNLLANAPQTQAAAQTTAVTPAVTPVGPPSLPDTKPIGTAPTPARTIAEPPMAANKTLADSAPVAHKKIIKPIDDITKQPDLSSLLAAEEAKHPSLVNPVIGSNDSQPAPEPPKPPLHQPGNVFSPAANPADSTPGTGIDPSSIAL
jgi:CheY-like chemotaxis protein